MLKFLFTAHFDDGTVIQQTQEDKSLTEDGSRFTDVLAYSKKSPIIGFELCDEIGVRAAVDLVSGLFEINGVVFLARDPTNRDPGKDEQLRLIYYRQVTQSLHSDSSTSTDIAFHIGYQYNDVDGKNVQQCIVLY